jgi:hypothetical protein
MKSVSKAQFIATYENEGGDFAFHFDRMSTHLIVPWRDIDHTSRAIMIFGD